ncbi:E3 ubiquitin-protein ligase rififylin isoform X3 [Ooceraea biroi]|uniref:E3 ubiquitin-protein ligase rififylin isoform X3 n=1 Tax=Ooceraea biroi TaxID=2015173 RepID=UPI0009715AD8|nr:E3 ubiquitin-protein ligase rififylin isoform X3 [Ooceraea biroi]
MSPLRRACKHYYSLNRTTHVGSYVAYVSAVSRPAKVSRLRPKSFSRSTTPGRHRVPEQDGLRGVQCQVYLVQEKIYLLANFQKQCMDCLRYFCSECVIKRLGKVFTCDSCGILSRRPLVKNQIRQMRSRDLRQYLVAKKVSVKGCVEKEDLVHLLMLFANGTDPCLNTDYNRSNRTQNAEEPQVDPSVNATESMPNVSTANGEPDEDAQTRMQRDQARQDVEMEEAASESEGSPIISVPLSSDNEIPEPIEPPRSESFEIEEVLEGDGAPTAEPGDTAEPVITEHVEVVSEASSEKKSDMVTEIPTVRARIVVGQSTIVGYKGGVGPAIPKRETVEKSAEYKSGGLQGLHREAGIAESSVQTVARPLHAL